MLLASCWNVLKCIDIFKIYNKISITCVTMSPVGGNPLIHSLVRPRRSLFVVRWWYCCHAGVQLIFEYYCFHTDLDRRSIVINNRILNISINFNIFQLPTTSQFVFFHCRNRYQIASQRKWRSELRGIFKPDQLLLDFRRSLWHILH